MAPAVGILMGGARIHGMKVIFVVVEVKKETMFVTTKGNVPLMKMEIASMVHIGPEADSFMTAPDFYLVVYAGLMKPRHKQGMTDHALVPPVAALIPPPLIIVPAIIYYRRDKEPVTLIVEAGVDGAIGTIQLRRVQNVPLMLPAEQAQLLVLPAMWLLAVTNPNAQAGAIPEDAGQEGVLLPKNPKPEPVPEDQPVTLQNVIPMQHAAEVVVVEAEVGVEAVLIYTLTPIRLIRDPLLLSLPLLIQDALIPAYLPEEGLR